MDVERIREVTAPLTEAIAGTVIDQHLAVELERRFPPGGEAFPAIEAACHEAIAAGWMCREGGAGRRFGRVIEPGPKSGGLGVDVVDLEDVVGPHHRHPTGEVCMIMPLTAGAAFDGQGAGWKVSEAGSAHRRAVTGG
ncbi:MAG: DUF4863 family protein [Alphaproteobacteria bacterium]|nr:DUF4863 family protein [Alphaproteobacteria bacterium]